MGIFEVTLGPLLIGIFFNTYLYGILTFQYASYYNTAFNDPLWIRLTVFSLFCLDTFHSGSLIYLAWVYTVEDYTNPFALTKLVWPYPAWVFVATVTACITQVFLAYRIRRIKKSVTLYAVVLVLAASAFVFGIIFGVKISTAKTLLDTVGLNPLISIWLCLEVSVNVLITGILLYSLSQSRTGFQKSDNIIDRLMQATIQTGLFSSVGSILTLVLFLADRHTEFYCLFGVPISRLYCNTLMDALLCRENLRGMISLPSESTHISFTNNNIQLYVRKEIQTDVHIDDLELAVASPSITTWPIKRITTTDCSTGDLSEEK